MTVTVEEWTARGEVHQFYGNADYAGRPQEQVVEDFIQTLKSDVLAETAGDGVELDGDSVEAECREFAPSLAQLLDNLESAGYDWSKVNIANIPLMNFRSSHGLLYTSPWGVTMGNATDPRCTLISVEFND